jgi:hypothetical protein
VTFDPDQAPESGESRPVTNAGSLKLPASISIPHVFSSEELTGCGT